MPDLQHQELALPTMHPSGLTNRELLRYADLHVASGGKLPLSWEEELVKRFTTNPARISY